MSLETLIPYIVQHNALIIQVLVVTILLLVVYVAYRNFVLAKNAGAAPVGLGDMSQLEGTLKKLLEKANQVPAASSAAAGDNSGLLAEIEKMKKALEEKQGQIEKLKVAQAEATAAAAAGGGAAAEAAAPGMSAEEKAALDTQIKELQAKLSEYEIISEDIADLSFYKEENTKLQKEIESLKKGGAVASAPATEAAPAPAPEAPAAESAKPAPTMAGSAKATTAAAAANAPPPAAEPAPTPAAAPASTPAPAPAEAPAAPAVAEEASPAAPAAPAAAGTPAAPAANDAAAAAAAAKTAEETKAIDDDLMKEFELAVEAQKGSKAATTKKEEKPAAAAPATPADSAAATTAGEDNPLGTGLDIEKVAAEVSEFKDPAGDVNVLEGELNPDKLLEEAATMDQIKPEDAKLMNEFEDFVKKGGVG